MWDEGPFLKSFNKLQPGTEQCTDLINSLNREKSKKRVIDALTQCERQRVTVVLFFCTSVFKRETIIPKLENQILQTNHKS